MEIGMLWFDADAKRPIAEKVQRAVDFYAAKYGARPTECYVHPSLLPDSPAVMAGCRMHANKTILRNHFWLGIEKAVKA